jgi:ParB family chromosome partitioning protein
MTERKKRRGVFADLARDLDQTNTPGEKKETEREQAHVRTARNMMNRKFYDLDRKHVTVLAVDAKRIRIAKKHDRMVDLITEESVHDLKNSIQQEGQLEPVLVREVHDDPEHDYEIIAGARRWWIARYIKKPLRVVVKNVGDEEAFRLNEASNRYENVSPFERAQRLVLALDEFYDGSQKRLAEAIGRTEAYVSQICTLADLPAQVVKLCEDPREITIRNARQLRAAMKGKRAREAVMAEAARLTERGDQLSARALFPRLAGIGRNPSANTSSSTVKRRDTGTSVGTLKHRQGRTTLTLRVPVKQQAKFEQALEKLYKDMGWTQT